MNVREEKKVVSLTKTGELTLNNGNYEMNKQHQNTFGNFNQSKPQIHTFTTNPEISSVRNQLKLIKAKKTYNQEDNDNQLDQQMEQINNDINNLNQMVKLKQKEPVYASKPLGPKMRMNPFKKNETEYQQSDFKYEPTQVTQATSQIDTKKIPLINRILKIDSTKNSQKKVSEGLYFPEEENKAQKIEFQENQLNQDDLYVPSVQETKEVKRQPLPGSRNLKEEKPLIIEKSIEQQIKEAEEKNELLKEEDLIECSEGCGRSFKRDVYEKHVKVCKTVFQSKRQEFNSKAHRIANQQKQMKEKQMNKQQQQQEQEKGENEKWKQQSEGLRNIIKKKKNLQGDMN